MAIPTNANRSNLDQTQIFQRAFDESADRIRVDADISVDSATIVVETDYTTDSMTIGDPASNNILKINSNGSIDANVVISHADDSIRIGDGTNLITSTLVTGKQGLDVNVIAAPLPTGAATETTLNSLLTELQGKTEPSDVQDIRVLSSITDSISVPGVAQETTLSSIDTKIVTTLNGIKVDGSAVVQPVSQSGAWTIGLPTNAATDTLQTAGNLSLSNIDDKLPTLGQQISSNSLSVVLASDQTLTVNADLTGLTSTPDSVLLVGSIDGTASGTKYVLVNNLKQQILDSHDRQAEFTYADFGTSNQRVTQINYTSATFPGSTVQRVFNYTLVGVSYRRDDEVWTIV